MDPYYQNPYGQYPIAPTAYSNSASFGTADLGTYSYSSYPMHRVTSGSSYDSAMPSDCLSPITVDSNFEYDNCTPTYSNNYSTQQPYSTAPNQGSYSTSSTQAGIPRNTGGYQGPDMAQSSTMQSNSMQTSRPAEYGCLYEGCKQKPFRRHADLDRHIKHVHRSSADSFYCDYARCIRSEGSSSTGKDERPDTPFSRWDHYKAHLRDYHKEPIPKRGSRENGKFFDGRTFSSTWWRCSKCLRRNRVDNGQGYKCGNCSQSLEVAVIEERQRRYPSERSGEARRRR